MPLPRLIIRDWTQEPEDLELVWLAGLRTDAEDYWQVCAITRSIISGDQKKWWLSIGFLPILKPGTLYVGGEPVSLSARGIPCTMTIANLAAGTEVGADIIPRNLYSFGGHWGWGQRLLRYTVDDGECLIPTFELVRFLFSHNKTMAHALMRPSELMTLFEPINPGHYETLDIRFTREMPVKTLTYSFILEFAWLAVHPEGRRSWDSVQRRSSNKKFISMTPPPLTNSRLTFRGLHHQNRWLVLEIQALTGRRLPCKQLRFSHPSITDSSGGSEEQTRAEATKSRQRKINPLPDPGIDSTAGSGADVHQKTLPNVGRFGDFDILVPVEQMIGQSVGQSGAGGASDASPPGPPTVTGSDTVTDDPSGNGRPSMSVGEKVLGNGLPPVEFKFLDPAGLEYLGELESLFAVVALIADRHPKVHVSSSLYFLKKRGVFSWAGERRRTCLVVIFRPPTNSVVVLINIDHAGLKNKGLSSLLLRYDHECSLQEMEKHVNHLLTALVDNGGHWDAAAETELSSFVYCGRLPKLMRKRGKKIETSILNIGQND